MVLENKPPHFVLLNDSFKTIKTSLLNVNNNSFHLKGR